MASNPPQAAAAISPLAIATAFIKQYYMILSTNNSLIHRFYKGDSQISFAPSCNTPATSQSFSSLENVEEKFAWAANSRVDFANGSIDAQESVGGGILVVVTGEIFLEGTDEKKLFVQTFFLKDDGKRAPRRNYFVFNDVFRFLDREIKMESPKVEEDKVTSIIKEKSIIEKEKEVVEEDENSSPKSITSQQMNGHLETSKAQVGPESELETETESQPKDENVVVDDDDEKTNGITDMVEEDTKTISENEQIQDSHDKGVEIASRTVEKVPQETKNNASKKAQKSKPPGSWASLVAGSSSKNPNTTAEATHSPSSSKHSPKKEKDTSVSTNTTERPKRPPRPQEAEAESTPAQNTGNTNSRASGYGSKGSSSLYIKNVEEGITESNLKELFNEYPFKIVNDANAVNAIMKENRQTFHINGRAIEVEKKSSDRRRGGGGGNTGNGSRGGSGNGGSGNQKINLKGQHQRSHSGRRLNGGGRKGRTGGGDKKRDSATNSGNNNNNNSN